MRKLLISLCLALLAALSYPGTMPEENLKGYDPYLADRDGFDSLFINPAGMANQTEIFSITTEMGTWGKLENYTLFNEHLGYLEKIFYGSFSDSDAARLFPKMAQELDEATLKEVFANTQYADHAIEQLQDATTWQEMPPEDTIKIQENLQDGELQEKIMYQFDSIRYNLEFETRFGTLIRGFGLGIYGNLYALYSLGAQGIQDLVYENGIITGYGFEIGSLSLGFSGKFALLLTDDPSRPFRINDPLIEQYILYGHSWGLDAGLIWEPATNWRFGLVFNDIIGSITQQDHMKQGTVKSFLAKSLDIPNAGYTFSLDMSLGLSWQPNGKNIHPKFSIDFYDIIGLIRATQENYSGLEEYYESTVSQFLRHMRVGVDIAFLEFLSVGINYYMEYITLGIGLDISFLDFSIEIKTRQDFDDIGLNAMVKLRF